VLGTKFNVRARGNKLEVAVLEGIVKVSSTRDGKDSSILIGKGQILTCDKHGFPGQPESIPFNDYPGWTQGKLMFYKTSFRAACDELEMQFDLRIEIENSRALNASITGIVNSLNAENALATITQLTGSQYRHENGRYIIY
jgi:transmembrane sensor